MPQEREDLGASDPGRQQSHGVHLCRACGWSFPNPHPSSKQRRAHRKHCGRMEGYQSVGGNAELSDGSNRGVTVPAEELESGRLRSERNDEKVVHSTDTRASEETAEGHLDTLSPSSGSGFSDGSTAHKFTNDSDLFDNSCDNSSTKDYSASVKSASALSNDSEEIVPVLTIFPPANGSAENSDLSSVGNGLASSISVDLPDKEDQNGKVEQVPDILTDSSLCVYATLPDTKVDHSLTRDTVQNGFCGDSLVCEVEPNLETNRLNKESVIAKKQVLARESFISDSVEIELGFKDTAPVVHGGPGVLVDGITEFLAGGDKGDAECEATEIESFSQLFSFVDPESCVDTSVISFQSLSDSIEAMKVDEEAAKQMYQKTTAYYPQKSATEIDIADSTRITAPVENVGNHAIAKQEEVEMEPPKEKPESALIDCVGLIKINEVSVNEPICVINDINQDNAVEMQRFCGPNDERKEPSQLTMPFASESLGLLSKSNLEVELEGAVCLERSTALDVNSVCNQCPDTDSISYQALEQQEGCTQTSKTDNVLSKGACTETEEQNISSLHSIRVQNGQYSAEGNSSIGLECDVVCDVKVYTGLGSQCPRMVLNASDDKMTCMQSDKSKAVQDGSEDPLDGLKEQLGDHLNKIDGWGSLKEHFGNKVTTLEYLSTVLNAPECDILDTQIDHGKALEKDSLEASIDGLKLKLVGNPEQIDSSIQTGGEVASLDFSKETSGDQKTITDVPVTSSIMEDKEDHFFSEKLPCKLLSHERKPEDLNIVVLDGSVDSSAFVDNILLDGHHQKIDDNSYETLFKGDTTEPAVVAKPSLQSEKDHEFNEQLLDQKAVNIDPWDGHNDIEKGESSSCTPDTEWNHGAHRLVDLGETGCKLQPTDTGVPSENGLRETTTKDCQSEIIPPTLSYAENDIQVILAAMIPGHGELSPTKDEFQIDETGSETTAGKHLSSSLITDRDSEFVSTHSESPTDAPTTDARLDTLASIQMITTDLGISEGHDSTDPSEGPDHHSGVVSTDRRQPDVAALSALSSSADPISGNHVMEGPNLIDGVDTPTITNHPLNESQHSKKETTISPDSWVSNTDDFASPASGVNPATEASMDIQPASSSKYCTIQEKTNGEIMEAPISRSSSKLRTPLKSLLDDASIESKQGIWQLSSRSPVKEHTTAKGISSGAANNQSTQHAVKIVPQKEWNSPARLPQSAKNSKVKNKGKPQWMPFMCCPSAN